MVAVEPLTEAIRTAYQSVFVANEKPLSLLLIAETDSGKSDLILSYRPVAECVLKAIHVETLSDVSASGLYRIVRDKTNPVIIIIPDFHAVVSHKTSVTENTINSLMSLLQDGVMKVSVGPGEPVELKGKRASLITAMTPGILSGKAGKWRKLGFMRRLLPVHYTYSETTSRAIHESIRKGEYYRDVKPLTVPVVAPQVVTIPAPFDSQVEDLAKDVSRNLENRGFTAHKFFRVYAKSRALIHGRNRVTEVEYKELLEFSDFCNLSDAKQI